jgi:hypothetical protein
MLKATLLAALLLVLAACEPAPRTTVDQTIESLHDERVVTVPVEHAYKVEWRCPSRSCLDLSLDGESFPLVGVAQGGTVYRTLAPGDHRVEGVALPNVYWQVHISPR